MKRLMLLVKATSTLVLLQLVLLSLVLLLSDLTTLVVIIEPPQRSPKMFEQYSVLKTSPAKPQKKEKKIPNLIPK